MRTRARRLCSPGLRRAIKLADTGEPNLGCACKCPPPPGSSPAPAASGVELTTASRQNRTFRLALPPSTAHLATWRSLGLSVRRDVSLPHTLDARAGPVPCDSPCSMLRNTCDTGALAKPALACPALILRGTSHRLASLPPVSVTLQYRLPSHNHCLRRLLFPCRTPRLMLPSTSPASQAS